MREWIKKAITYKVGDVRGAQSLVADLLAKECAWSVGRGKLNKLCKGRQTISATDLYDIAQVTGYPLPPIKTGDKPLDDFMEIYKRASPAQRDAALAAAKVFLEKTITI